MTIPYSALDQKKALDKKGEPFRIYGLWGDAFLQEQSVNFLLDLLVEPDARDFNLDVLDGETVKIPEVLAACGAFPFLSDRRVVVVKRAEKMDGLAREEAGTAKKKKTAGTLSAAQKLEAGFNSLPETATLILCRTPETPEAGEKPGERCLNAALDALIQKREKSGGSEAERGLLINCAIGAKNLALAVSVLEFQARHRDIPLAKGAAQFLVERCGTDIAFLIGELEKCALMAGIGTPVTPAIITEMTRPALHDTVFDLVDAVGNRAGGKAIEKLRDLFAAGHKPEALLPMIIRQIRQLIQARTFLDANLSLDGSLASRLPPDIMAQLPRESKDNLALSLSHNAWAGSKLTAQARRFSQPQLQKALVLVYEADLALKGIEGDGGFVPAPGSGRRVGEEATLEILIAKLCGI